MNAAVSLCMLACVAETTCNSHGTCASGPFGAICRCDNDPVRGFYADSTADVQMGRWCTICASGFEGKSCLELQPTAHNACVHGTVTSSGLCNCTGNWEGSNCTVCPHDPSNGFFVGEDCESCESGWWGEACTLRCPYDGCSGHGRCDRHTGECDCSANSIDGWWAPPSCSQCRDGYLPKYSQLYAPIPHCSRLCNGDTCVYGKCDTQTGECVCTAANSSVIGGLSCDTCASSNRAILAVLWHERILLAQQGVTDVPSLQQACELCAPGFAGYQCSVALCSAATCSAHGSCTDTTEGPHCQCDRSNGRGFWGGSRCSECLQGYTTANCTASESSSCQAPSVAVRAEFSLRFDYIFVQFTKAVVALARNTRDCEAYLSSETLDRVGWDSECYLSNTTLLVVAPSPNVEPLAVGAEIVIRAGAVRDLVCSTYYLPRTSLIVELSGLYASDKLASALQGGIQPYLLLSAEDAGECDNVLLSLLTVATSTRYSSHFAVVEAFPMYSSDAVDYERAFASARNLQGMFDALPGTARSVELPREAIPPNTAFRFDVTVRDLHLGFVSRSSFVEVRRHRDPRLVLQWVSKPSSPVFAVGTVILRAVVVWPDETCTSNASSPGNGTAVQLTWTSVPSSFLLLAGVSGQNTAELRFPTSLLAPTSATEVAWELSEPVTFTLTAAYGPFADVTLSTAVVATPPPLRVEFVGGRRKFVGPNATCRVFASCSDPFDAFLPRAGISFSWMCVTSIGQRVACPTTSMSAVIDSAAAGVVDLTATLPSSSYGEFWLAVTCRKGWRSANETITVSVSASPAANCTVEIDVSPVEGSTLRPFAPSETLVLTARMVSSDAACNCSYEWSCNICLGSLQLEESNNGARLALPPYSLVPGSRVVFAVRESTSSALLATREVVVAACPTSGKLSASLTTVHVSSSELIRIDTFDWVLPSWPLASEAAISFGFEYRFTVTNEAGEEISLSGWTETVTVTTPSLLAAAVGGIGTSVASSCATVGWLSFATTLIFHVYVRTRRDSDATPGSYCTGEASVAINLITDDHLSAIFDLSSVRPFAAYSESLCVERLVQPINHAFTNLTRVALQSRSIDLASLVVTAWRMVMRDADIADVATASPGSDAAMSLLGMWVEQISASQLALRDTGVDVAHEALVISITHYLRTVAVEPIKLEEYRPYGAVCNRTFFAGLSFVTKAVAMTLKSATANGMASLESAATLIPPELRTSLFSVVGLQAECAAAGGATEYGTATSSAVTEETNSTNETTTDWASQAREAYSTVEMAVSLGAAFFHNPFTSFSLAVRCERTRRDDPAETALAFVPDATAASTASFSGSIQLSLPSYGKNPHVPLVGDQCLAVWWPQVAVSASRVAMWSRILSTGQATAGDAIRSFSAAERHFSDMDWSPPMVSYILNDDSSFGLSVIPTPNNDTFRVVWTYDTSGLNVTASELLCVSYDLSSRRFRAENGPCRKLYANAEGVLACECWLSDRMYMSVMPESLLIALGHVLRPSTVPPHSPDSLREAFRVMFNCPSLTAAVSAFAVAHVLAVTISWKVVKALQRRRVTRWKNRPWQRDEEMRTIAPFVFVTICRWCAAAWLALTKHHLWLRFLSRNDALNYLPFPMRISSTFCFVVVTLFVTAVSFTASECDSIPKNVSEAFQAWASRCVLSVVGIVFGVTAALHFLLHYLHLYVSGCTKRANGAATENTASQPPCEMSCATRALEEYDKVCLEEVGQILGIDSHSSPEDLTLLFEDVPGGITENARASDSPQLCTHKAIGAEDERISTSLFGCSLNSDEMRSIEKDLVSVTPFCGITVALLFQAMQSSIVSTRACSWHSTLSHTFERLQHSDLFLRFSEGQCALQTKGDVFSDISVDLKENGCRSLLDKCCNALFLPRELPSFEFNYGCTIPQAEACVGLAIELLKLLNETEKEDVNGRTALGIAAAVLMEAAAVIEQPDVGLLLLGGDVADNNTASSTTENVLQQFVSHLHPDCEESSPPGFSMSLLRCLIDKYATLVAPPEAATVHVEAIDRSAVSDDDEPQCEVIENAASPSANESSIHAWMEGVLRGSQGSKPLTAFDMPVGLMLGWAALRARCGEKAAARFERLMRDERKGWSQSECAKGATALLEFVLGAFPISLEHATCANPPVFSANALVPHGPTARLQAIHAVASWRVATNLFSTLAQEMEVSSCSSDAGSGVSVVKAAYQRAVDVICCLPWSQWMLAGNQSVKAVVRRLHGADATEVCADHTHDSWAEEEEQSHLLYRSAAFARLALLASLKEIISGADYPAVAESLLCTLGTAPADGSSNETDATVAKLTNFLSSALDENDEQAAMATYRKTAHSLHVFVERAAQTHLLSKASKELVTTVPTDPSLATSYVVCHAAPAAAPSLQSPADCLFELVSLAVVHHMRSSVCVAFGSGSAACPYRGIHAGVVGCTLARSIASRNAKAACLLLHRGSYPPLTLHECSCIHILPYAITHWLAMKRKCRGFAESLLRRAAECAPIERIGTQREDSILSALREAVVVASVCDDELGNVFVRGKEEVLRLESCHDVHVWGGVYEATGGWSASSVCIQSPSCTSRLGNWMIETPCDSQTSIASGSLCLHFTDSMIPTVVVDDVLLHVLKARRGSPTTTLDACVLWLKTLPVAEDACVADKPVAAASGDAQGSRSFLRTFFAMLTLDIAADSGRPLRQAPRSSCCMSVVPLILASALVLLLCLGVLVAGAKARVHFNATGNPLGSLTFADGQQCRIWLALSFVVVLWECFFHALVSVLFSAVSR